MVVVPYLISRSPEDFYKLLVHEQVTVLNQTPSAFKQLSQAEERIGVSKDLKLRYLIFGGEALEMASLKPWFDRHGDQHPKLVNMYGITETTVHVTYHPLSSKDLNGGSVVGVPIPDLQVHLLDQHQQPVPIGVIGEIYVGGAGVARGYLNRDDLTQQRFLKSPFGSAGRKLYRTGDLARRLPTMEIEYIGRADQQVKIRGFRVELGEIETTLAQHPSIRQTVVVPEDAAGERRLIAYYEVHTGKRPDIGELRAHLKKELPDYMVPALFVRVEHFALTANGKIDRKSLPTPEQLDFEPTSTPAAPRDSWEQLLVRLWSKVLRLKHVGVNDNFFDLGGHSLLAVRIVSEIEKVSKIRLPLATLLHAPTVAELAEVLRRRESQPSWSCLVPLKSSGYKTPLFLMHAHGGNVLEYLALANELDPDQPVYAFQALGLDGKIDYNQSLEDMAAAYLCELRMLQPEGPYFLGGFCFGGLLALEVARQLKTQGEVIASLFLIQTVRPGTENFKPETGVFRRSLQRASKRLELEKENLRSRGAQYVTERSIYLLSRARARAQLFLHTALRNGDPQASHRSTQYILECLSIKHDRIFVNHTPKPYPGSVIIIRAQRQFPGVQDDPFLGWRELFSGKVETIEVPGHQQTMLIYPNVSLVAKAISAFLENSHEASSPELLHTDKV